MRKLFNLSRILLLVCLVSAGPLHAGVPGELDEIIPGNWIQVRGHIDSKGVFQAQRVELLEPEDKELLTGTVSTSSKSGEFMLLGQRVQISEKTRFTGVTASKLLNQTVKVEGYYRGPKRFSSRKIRARDPGRERIAGPVRYIRKVDDGYFVNIMKFDVHIPEGVELRHEKPIAEYGVVSINAGLPAGNEVSEDDQLGDGIHLFDRIRFTTLIETRYTGEDNYDLDKRRDVDREDSAATIRGLLIMSPSDRGVSGQIEIRQALLRRNEDPFGTFRINDTQIGESFIFLDDPFDINLSFQAGRMDFDDRREWVYDQSLDGVRVFWRLGGWLAELSATTTLSDGKPRDEKTDNYIAYVSDIDRRFAAYLVHRDSNYLVDEKITHMGFRAFADWPPEHKSWFEISRMSGHRASTSLGGWGLDVGTTRNLGQRWYLTAGWAFGQGDNNTRDGRDGTFRQTRLQDNNGKFGGVTSFRYYGELVDPELANLHVGTLGIGYRFTRKASIDLVGHYYRQDKAVRKIVDSDIDQRPNGVNRTLGWEVDAVIGWRPVRMWDFEFVLGRFKPGKAFVRKDDAWVSKLQVRFRY